MNMQVLAMITQKVTYKFMDVNLFDHIDIDKSNTHIPDASAENLNQALENYQK